MHCSSSSLIVFSLLLFICLYCNGQQVSEEQNLAEGLDQLNSRLTTQFELHSRIDFVQQGITQNVKGRLHTRDDNFDRLTDEASRKLDKFFQQKIVALQKIVESAEKEINGLNYDDVFINNEDDCENYQQKINKINLYNTPLNSRASNRSGVHISVEAFKCDNSVVRDFEWTSMKKIEKAFIENIKNDKTLLRQYIGTYTGITRIFPAFQWETEPLLSVDLFDSRFRPWFLGAESAPKDILFLLDYSGSVKGQNLHLMKINIMQMLAQLTPNDYFNAVWYNSKQEYMLEPCSEDRFVAATTRNKRMFQDFLGKIEEHDQATLPPALNMSLIKYLSDEYIGSTRQNQTSGGHQLIFLLTDGIEYWPTEEIQKFKSANPEKKVRVFGFAVGRGTGEIKALQWIACETGGCYSNVDSISDVKLKVRRHIAKLSESLAYSLKKKPVNKRPISYSFPYMDAQSEGAVLTLSAPILNKMFTSNGTVEPDENNSFIGVAGVDLSLERLRLMLPNTEQIKSFIIDNNGITFYHPKLKIPDREIYAIRRTACHVVGEHLRHRTGTRVQFGPANERIKKLIGHIDSISTLDVLEIESNFSSKFASFRNSMVRGDCSKVFEDNDKQYKCARIENTPLTVGFVLHKNKQVLELDERVEKLAFEENDLVGDWIREPTLCSEFLSIDAELERFESLVDMAEKKAECLSTTHQGMLSGFIRSIADWRASWPLLDGNMTCSVNPRPNGFHNFYLNSFVEYAPGIVSFYPKCEFSPVQQFFNNRPQILDDNSNNQHMTLYIDPFTHIITIFRAILDNVTKRQIALIGAQFKPEFINSIWSEMMKKSQSWEVCKNSKGKCYIVTKDAYIVASTNFYKSGLTHLAAKEPVLFDQLVSTNAITGTTLTDYQAKCQMAPIKTHQASSTPTSSSNRPIQLLTHVANIAYTWLTFDLFKQFGQSVSIEEDCQFIPPALVEQCVMKYPLFEIQINKSLTVSIKAKKGCTGSATIVPSGLLYAIHVESNCQSTQKKPIPEDISKHQFVPTRVSECNLAKRRVRYRIANSAVTKYPEERMPECSYSTKKQITSLAMILLFILKLLQ